MVGAVILMIVSSAGCLGSGAPKVDLSSVKCSESLVPGQNMTINETQNNATICAKLNSSMMIELPDPTRMGGEWTMTASPGLQLTDEGLIVQFFDVNGTSVQGPSNGPGIVTYTHAWNVTMTGTGVQTLKGDTQFPGRSSSPVPAFNLTIVVE